MSDIRSRLLSPSVVPVNGVEGVFVRKFSLEVLLSFSDYSDAPIEDQMAKLVVASACEDVGGRLLFTDADIESVKRGDGELLKKIADAAMVLNGLGKSGAAEAKND